MNLIRHFYIGDDLEDLERLERDLESAGLATPQIHVLTLDDSGAERRTALHEVTSLMKRDLVRSTLVGASLGAVGGALVLFVAWFAGWQATPAGWIPWIFLALIVFGFTTWEGGLWGIQEPNRQFRRFRSVMEKGRHVFFVDVEPSKREMLAATVSRHRGLEGAGTGVGAPGWLISLQLRFRRLFFETLP